MPDPIIERIAVVLKARLERITVPNGFANTVAGVLRPPRMGAINPKHLQIVLVQDDPVLNDDEKRASGSGLLLSVDQQFNIFAFVRPSDQLTTPIDTLLNSIEADIRKAVTNPEDGTQWTDFREADGTRLAVRAQFDASEHFPEASGSLDGVAIPLIIKYRTPENDPYSVG